MVRPGLVLLCSVWAASAAAGPCRSAWAAVKAGSQEIIITEGEPPDSAALSGSGTEAVAWGHFQDAIEETGWAFLQVGSNSQTPDEIQAYAAGAIEGYLSRDLMEYHWENVFGRYCDNQTEYCDRVEAFIRKNLEYSLSQEEKLSSTDPYWNMVKLQMQQLSGLSDVFDGKNLTYTRRVTTATKALYFNIVGDLIDLEEVLNREFDVNSLSQVPSCSALVKVVGKSKDLFISHATWSLYRSMLRIKKKYSLPWHYRPSWTGQRMVIPGHTITMTSYPGCLDSWDHFMFTSAGLVIFDTTIPNNNSALWLQVRPDNAPLTWVRSNTANRLAASAPEWRDVFSTFNSDTYNNQWLIVDHKLFTPGQPIRNGTLWILEQMPGMIRAEDVSQMLSDNEYWAGYNTAYNQDIFEISGQPAYVEKYGDYYTFERSPRARIFRRDQGNVTDIKSLMRLMRYNDYENDPLSRCNGTPSQNPVYAIAARYDLLDPEGDYGIPDIYYRPVGAIDVKLANARLATSMEFIAVNGPTNDQQPVFKWSTSGFNDSHLGQPDTFNFGPIHGWGACPNLSWR
ncbi:putative phospholipase B-like 2 isoform X2 [Haemaphysalis longicornis]